MVVVLVVILSPVLSILTFPLPQCSIRRRTERRVSQTALGRHRYILPVHVLSSSLLVHSTSPGPLPYRPSSSSHFQG